MNRPVCGVATVLLVAGCGTSGPSAASEGAVVGRVLSAPSCPVERQGVPCPPRPVADATVVLLRAGHVIASTHTDARGRFHLTAPEGRSTVRGTNAGGYTSSASKTVTVLVDQVVRVRLVVDSGIR